MQFAKKRAHQRSFYQLRHQLKLSLGKLRSGTLPSEFAVVRVLSGRLTAEGV